MGEKSKLIGLIKNKFRAGKHSFHWKKLSKVYENGTIHLNLKALYSTQNTIKKEIKLDDSNM